MNKKFLSKQIITYMGNKRKFVTIIGKIVDNVKEELNGKDLVLADGFSGSGIIARLFKIKGVSLHVNDIAGYSETLNKCYLSTPTPKQQKIISIHGYDSDNESDFWICLNESTAIKFAKTIRTEINKIKNSDFETKSNLF